MAGYVVDSETISELRLAAKECAERGLLVASKWYVSQTAAITEH